jgi:ABC-2 type transport system permease protein
MTGPGALSGSPRRFVHLTRTLAVTEFKLRFFDSVLGYLWTLMKPLLSFGVLFVVFSELVRIGGGARNYPVTLLSGIILFQFFQESTSRSVTAVADNESLVRKIHFPRLAIPLSTVLTAGFNFGLNLIVLLGFVLVSDIHPRVSWLGLILLVAALAALTAGVSMLLSALYVFARDVQPIWEVAAQALFYATPILYPIERVLEHNETAGHVMMCNPLAAIVEQARHWVIDPGAPSAAQAIGGAAWLAIPAALTLAACAGGFVVFNRSAPRIAEEL